MRLKGKVISVPNPLHQFQDFYYIILYAVNKPNPINAIVNDNQPASLREFYTPVIIFAVAASSSVMVVVVVENTITACLLNAQKGLLCCVTKFSCAYMKYPVLVYILETVRSRIRNRCMSIGNYWIETRS
jgi:hypothetical protein